MNTQNIKLSLTPGIIRPIVAASQYDTARPVSLSYDDSITFTTVEIHGTRPDGAKVTQQVTASGLVISWTPNADFTAVEGDVLAEAVFLRSGSRVGTANFILRVEPAGAKADAPGPYDTLTVTEPGTYNCRPYAEVIVDVEAPSGALDVSENGTYDVSGKSTVRVAVPEPSGVAAITENGRYDVKDRAVAAVNVPVGVFPEGTKRITANGSNINVHEYEAVDVAVPVGIVPEGTRQITANGTYDVTEKAAVEVSVPVGVFPSGTAAITENGRYDVEQYKTVNVNVEQGVFPEGTALITRNGLYEIEQYEKARVNVPGTPEEDVIANFLDVRGSYPAVLDLSATRIAWATMYGLYARPYEEVILNADRISNYFFAECEEMTKATLINPSSIASHCFEHCASLQELHIQCTAVPTLDAQAFELTPIYSGTGKIYFPTQALADAAKQATNWSFFASKIYAEP